MKLLIVLLLTAFICTSLRAEEPAPPADVQKMAATLLEATENNDLDKFKSVCDQAMREAMSADLLQEVHTQVGASLAAGFQQQYLVRLDRGPIQTYLWKISFKKAGEHDVLLEVSVKDSLVAGAFLR